MSNLNKLAWNNVDWKKVESRVFRMQRRIYKAKSKNKTDTVHYLQDKLLNSFDAKLLSLRKVSPIPKSIVLVNKLILKRMVKKTSTVTNRKNKKVKPEVFNIAAILEKAKETLIKLVIEPEWEVLFSINCCGGRPGYRYQDAILKVLKNIDSKPSYVLTIDLSNSFNKFNYGKLLKKLNTTKIIKNHICYWLELNFMRNFFQESNIDFEIQNKKIVKNDTLAPLLCNITLHGLENHLIKWNLNLSNKEEIFNKLNYIQYLDKILISNRNKNTLEKVKETILSWLSKEGINCTQNQFSIKKTTEGFQFLGFHIIVIKKRNKYITKTYISKESKNALLKKTRIIIQKNKSVSAYKLITNLGPTITNWKNYFIHSDCNTDFKQMDNRLFTQLRAWVFRRKANGKNRHFLKEKYFPKGKKYMYENKIHKSNWILYGKTKNEVGKTYENYLPKLTWSKPKYYVKIEKKPSLYI
jgi:RNA-directed DNA polymerase